LQKDAKCQTKLFKTFLQVSETK